MAHPNPKGRAIPAAPTLRAIRQFDRRSRKSTSRPTKNRNNIRPRLAAVFRTGIEAVGNMAAVKPGIRPKTEGPSRIPPIISAMTRGCLILERGKCRTRQKMMMIPACCSKSQRRNETARIEYTYLNDEESDGIRGIPFAWVCAFYNAALGRYFSSSGGGRRSVGGNGGGHHMGDYARHGVDR